MTTTLGPVPRPIGVVGVRCALVAVLLLASLTLGAGGASAAPHQDDEPSPRPRLTVRFQDLEVDARGDFRVLLDAVDAPAGSDIAVDIYDRITDAEGLAASATSTPANLRDNFEPIPLSADEEAIQATAFTISIFGSGDARPVVGGPLPPYRLDEPGVYPIGVRLRAADGEVLTSIVTYLVRRPSADQSADGTRVALLATVHQAPEVSDDNGPGSDDGPVDDEPTEDGPEPDEPSDDEPGPVSPFVEDLASFLAAVEARPELPVSFAVTPDTVAGLAVDPASLDTIDTLRTELARANRELLGAPYVDLDPASLVDNGLVAELVRQIDLGQRTLQSVLDRPGSATWLLDERLDPDAVDAVGAVGVDHLVLTDDAIARGSITRPQTLTGTAGDVDAVATGFFDLTGPVPSDPLLAGNQLLGRMAAAASLTPGGADLVIRVDPQRVDPIELATVVDHLDGPSSILTPTTVTALFEGAPPGEGAATLTPPTGTRLDAYSSLVRETHGLLASYASMVPDRPELVGAFERPLALSAASDLDLAERIGILGGVTGDLRRRFAAVSAPDRDRVTLGTRDGQFPLPIQLDLDEPARVMISLEASDRLQFPDEQIETTLTDGQTLVQIPVRTRATGDTPLRITIRTPDGEVLLAESRYSVRSTAVSGVGVLLTIGAAGFLALWWGRHWHQDRSATSRRARRRHRSDDQPEDDLFVDDASASPVDQM